MLSFSQAEILNQHPLLAVYNQSVCLSLIGMWQVFYEKVLIWHSLHMTWEYVMTLIKGHWPRLRSHHIRVFFIVLASFSLKPPPSLHTYTFWHIMQTLPYPSFRHSVRSIHWSCNIGPHTCYMCVVHTQHLSLWKVDGVIPKLNFKQVRKLNVQPISKGVYTLEFTYHVLFILIFHITFHLINQLWHANNCSDKLSLYH